MRRSLGLLALASLFFACSGETETDDLDPRDAGPSRDAGVVAPEVEVGTGQTTFTTLDPGAPLEIERGAQAAGEARYNGFHVWLGLRARGIDPSDARFTFTVRAAGTELATGSYRQPLTRDGDGYVVFGQRLILSDCCLAEDADVEVEVQLIDGAGVTLSDLRTVRGGACVPGLPNPTIDPCP